MAGWKTFRAPESLMSKLEVESERTGRTQAAIIRISVDAYLAEDLVERIFGGETHRPCKVCGKVVELNLDTDGDIFIAPHGDDGECDGSWTIVRSIRRKKR